jgi:hypothetical protein
MRSTGTAPDMARRYTAVVLTGNLLILGLLPLISDIAVPTPLGLAAFAIGLVSFPAAVAWTVRRDNSAQRRFGRAPERPEL